MNYIKTHIFYIAAIAIAVFAFRSWLSEHDNKLLALQQEKISEQHVADLEQTNASLRQAVADADAAAKQKDQYYASIIKNIKTPAQAIAAIPKLESVPLNARAAVDSPTQVSVDAIPLANALAACQTNAADLGACKVARTNDELIIANKDKELKEKDAVITQLKKPQGFWRKFLGTLRDVSIGIGIGAVGSKL